jgi:hypothetical protein
MKRTTITLLTLLALGHISCNKTSSQKTESLKNTIYKFGFKTDSTSTGPLDNSAFIMKINDSLPAMFLTAHHTVAGTRNGQYLKWDEIEQNMTNGWAWSMNDSTVDFKIGRNLPVRNSETMKLDLSAFYLPSDKTPYLKPAKKNAQVGDTVYLFSRIKDKNNRTTLRNRAVVIYATDSVMAYELTDFSMQKSIMTGTSGSCVLNKDNEVTSNSYAGFTIPNDEIKKKIAEGFPLLNKLKTRSGKTYGIGVPIQLIQKSIILAFKEKRVN